MAKKLGQFLGNSAKLYGDTYLSAVGLGDVISDKAYKGDNADRWATTSNVTGGIAKVAAPMVANAIAPGSGAIVSGGQAVLGSTLNKPIKGLETPTPEPQKVPQPSYMKETSPTTYQKYEEGGEVEGLEGDHVMVNVEKGELEVNPKTGEIVRHFNSVPKHPKGKNIVNLKGNVHVSKANVIIPAKVSNKYLTATKEDRLKLIAEVVKNAEAIEERGEGEMEGKMVDGGFAPDVVQDDVVEDIVGTPSGISEQTRLGAIGANADTTNPFSLQGGTADTFNKNAKTPRVKGDINDPYSLGAGAAAIPALALGSYQTIQSKKALEDLAKKPQSKFDITPEQYASQKRATESFGRAQQLAKSGFTEAEKANYQQTMAKANATNLYNARNVGGGQMSGAFNAAAGSQNLNALLDYASKDAALNRQNISYADRMGQYLGQVQGDITAQRNRQTNVDQQNRLRIEQALGTARSQGQTNITNAAGQMLGSAVTNNPNLFA